MEWININDELPHSQDFYLVSGEYLVMAYWNGEYFGLKIDGVDRQISDVTHWMPLPAPPTN